MQRSDSGDKEMKWMIGVTTAPRPQPTISRCLESLVTAKWDEWIIYDDGEYKLGPYPLYYLALTDMYMREPNADAYMMIQDDVVLSEDARPYLESIWHTVPTNMGVLNLWVRSGREVEYVTGVHKPVYKEISIGACCLVFSQLSIRRFLLDGQLLIHVKNSRKHIDGMIRRWCKRINRPEYLHHPSLAQHIGVNNSAIGHDKQSAVYSASFVKDVRCIGRG